MNETDVIRIIEEYEKKRQESSVWYKTKNFVVKNFTTLVICVLLFWCLGGGDVIKNYAAGWFARFFNVQINNALIQRIIPDNTDRQGFIDRIKKLFDNEYANADQFQTEYRMTTADYRYKYPQLKELIIKNKDELSRFIEGG